LNLSHVAHENVTADRRRAVKEEPWRLEEMKVMRREDERAIIDARPSSS